MDAAVQHLHQAGANLPPPPAEGDSPKAKALQLITAAKAVPQGFDPAQYAIGEAWDAATMAGVIPCLAQLLSSETYQQDPEGVALIQSLIKGASDFIASEVDDMGEALDTPAPAEPDTTDAPLPNGTYYASLQQADALVAFGSEVKALGNGLVGGYLVRYGNEAKTDLAGDFFNAKTDFGSATETDVYYNHGLDPQLGRKAFKNKAQIGRDDIGEWIKHQLDLRDEYEKAVYGLVEQMKQGWSSGTASHLVEREPVGKAYWIKRWPLGLDASYTPTPAEPQNNVIPLKSLTAVKPGQAGPDGPPAATSPAELSGANDMTPEELKALRDEQAAIKTQNDKIIAQNERLIAATEEQTKALKAPALPTAPAQADIVQTSPEMPFKSLGEQMIAISDVTTHQNAEKWTPRLEAVKTLAIKATGANEGVSSEGGFLVQSDFAGDIFQRSYATGAITSRCTKQPIGAGFNGTKIPAVDETSRVDGSRWGGVRAYWGAEAATMTKSKPVWRLVVLELKKLFCLVYGTDELLQDATAFDGYLNRVVPLEMSFKLEDAIINGLGGGFPLGILNAPATVSVAKDTNQQAASITYTNVLKMYSRLWAGGQGPNVVPGGGSMSGTVWLVNQDVLPALAQMQLPVGTGGSAVFLPPGGASGTPYGQLLGRPIIAVEQCATLGTVGDIVLVDLSQYALADKGGVQAATSIHVQFLTDETAYRWTFRTDGQPLWNSALTPFKGTNTQSAYISLATRA